MAYLNFSWILEGALAGSQGPMTRRDLILLKLHDITAVIRMQEGTISGEALELAEATISRLLLDASDAKRGSVQGTRDVIRAALAAAHKEGA